MKWQQLIGIVLPTAAAISAAYPLAAQQKPTSGPIARYDMRAGTVSGLPGGGGAGSGMGMMFGGSRSANVQRELYLRLGSSRDVDKGIPNADHFMPPGVKIGKSVALVTPREEKVPDGLPEKPKGRLLVFWGCGDHAPKGQPVVIDFAKVAAGQTPSGLWSTTILRDWGPTIGNSRTFGRWPAEDGKYIKTDSSLTGPHRIAANYSPEIAFTLTKDFMAALTVRTGSTPGGATLTSWTGIAGATGYLVGLLGGKQGPSGTMGDMVMWTSSANRQFGGGLADWLSPSQVAPLVKDRTLLPPTATSCTIPTEVNAAAPDFRVGSLTAFGPEEDFAFPPRPADARTPWNLEWTARIRHRSTTSWMQMEGMAMGAMDSADDEEPAPRDCKRKGGLGGLGGMLGGMVGGGKGC